VPAQRPSIVCTGGIIVGLQGEHIHALTAAGGLVMQHAPDGDWKCVDWDALPPGSTDTVTRPLDARRGPFRPPTQRGGYASGNARVKTHRRWTS